MTKAIAVNSANDMYMDVTNNLAVAYGLTATLQACAQAAKTILGEMIFQTDNGIPYFQQVFNGVPNIPQYQAALRVAWLAVADVIEVVSLTIIQVGNTLKYNATLMTDYGQGTING